MKPGSNCEEHNVRDWQTTPTGRLCSVESTYPIMCNLKDRHFSSLELGFNVPIGLLQLAITWYKIRHAGGQAHYYSRTGT